MDTEPAEHPFEVQPGTHKILFLGPDVVPPLGGDLRLIAPHTLIVANEDFASLAGAGGDGPPPLALGVFDNSLIYFPLVPETLGAATVENDDNWGVTAEGTNALAFHQRGIQGQGVRIGIADSGIDSSHPAFANLLAENRLHGFAHFDKLGAKVIQKRPDGSLLPDDQAKPTFGHWHGTHCAGILVGQTTDGKLRGVAPRAELAVVRVLEEANEGTPAGILAGLWWLSTQACDIVSISLGRPGLFEVWWEPIEALLRQGVVVVAAVGNERLTPGVRPSRSPANYLATPNTAQEGLLIPVGAHNRSGVPWDESSGERVDWSLEKVQLSNGYSRPSVFANESPRIVPTLVAPGVDIISCSPPNGAFRASAGSSMATPHLAGLIALVLSELRSNQSGASPRAAADLVLSCLRDIAPDGEDTHSGRGALDNEALTQKLGALLSA